MENKGSPRFAGLFNTNPNLGLNTNVVPLGSLFLSLFSASSDLSYTSILWYQR